MDLRVVGGTANPALAASVAGTAGIPLTRCEVNRFPDGELRVEVDPGIRGDDVYVVQPTGPPTDRNLVELVMVGDACWRAGAGRLTAVVPYLAYARQDRRTAPGQPLALRAVGDLVAGAGFDRVVVADPHTPTVESVFDLPVEAATAVGVLCDHLGPDLPGDAVVVAPDLGAVKLAGQYAAHLERPMAMVRKTRLSGDRVRAGAVVGDVAGRTPVVVDDMISTGGTVVAAVEALHQAGAAGEVVVAATHGLFVGSAGEDLGQAPIARIVVSDSLPPPGDVPALDTAPIGGLLAEAVVRLHDERPVHDLETFR